MSIENQALRELRPKEVYAVAAGLLGVKGKLARARSPLEVHASLSSGLPVSAVPKLRSHLHILQWGLVVVEALGMSLRTAQRLEDAKDKHLSPEQSSRAWKFAEVLARATSVLGSQAAAEEWLNKPARAFEGKRPIELLATQTGTQLVEDFLEQMDYEVYV
jgi:putative toxin-antitoxin system antitoxin component (TIGR02293 family)